jgi:hypothetical protein
MKRRLVVLMPWLPNLVPRLISKEPDGGQDYYLIHTSPE